MSAVILHGVRSMKRLVILTAGVAFLFSTGCAHEEWSVQKALGLDSNPRGIVPGSRDAVKMAPADLAVAERVDNVGRKIVAQNIFIGIEPLFSTMKMKEDVLFHDGPEHLWISQGLVEKCATDAELTAVLCAELGKMIAEKRMAKAVGRNVEPIPDASFGGNNLPGGNPFDAGRQVEVSLHEKQFPRTANNIDADATNIARELLQGSGYSTGELDRVEGLLKQSKRGEQLEKQMAGSAPVSMWKK